MTSVNTNAAAITALRTLQQTNQALDSTQNRVSTGLRIGQAKDNAAYWAISTTLKSDNKSLSTVKDALGLGAATVDIAYQSLNQTKNVLDEIKSKLVAATQDGVDKVKIQGEIAELQKQLKAIAGSANFSGQNLLDVDSVANANQTTKIVSGYSRDASGAISISTIDVNTKPMVLIDRGAGKEGILDGGIVGNTSTATVVDKATFTAAATASYVTDTLDTTGITAVAQATDGFSITLKIDGVAITKSFANFTGIGATWASTTAGTIDEIGAGIAYKLNNDSDLAKLATFSYASGSDKLTFTSKTVGGAGGMELTALTIDSVSKLAQATGAGASATLGADAINTMSTAFASSTMTLDANDTLSFNLTVDGGSPTRVVVNKALISNVLGTTDGVINSSNNYKLVLQEAVRVAGLTNVKVDNASDTISFQGGTSSITVSAVNASKGVDITSFDMSKATSAQLNSYIAAVNTATEQVIAAATTLGSVASRIDLQKSFVNTLIDTIDKGVGNLIDADMTEESTKLQALQTKQQLGVQALSIANQSAQAVLRLFQ